MIITKNEKISMKILDIDRNGNIKKAELVVANTNNYPGILYKITGVLYIHGWSILSAKIRSHNGTVEDSFVVENVDNSIIDKNHLEKLEEDLFNLLDEGIHVSEYLSKFPEKTKTLLNNMKKDPNTEIQFYHVNDSTKAKFKLITSDRVGLLYFVSQILYLSNMDILDLDVNTINHKAIDIFIIQKRNKIEFNDKNLDDLKNLILKFI